MAQWHRCSEVAKYERTRLDFMDLLPTVRTRIEGKKREAEARCGRETQRRQSNMEDDEEADTNEGHVETEARVEVCGNRLSINISRKCTVTTQNVE